MKKPALILFLILLLPGCSTVAKYESKIAAGPAKPAEYPIYVYAEGIKVARPFEIIGTIRVSDTPFTMMGGSLEDVMQKLCHNARQQGADAVQLTAINPPGFTSPHFGAEANFLRFTNAWESVSFPEDELLAYYRTNGPTLDPIEGIWSANDPARSRIGIMKNRSKPRRDFVAIILSTGNPTWQRGDKKMDIVRGERPGVYRGNYYLDDYRETSMAFTLQGPNAGRFVIQVSDESRPIIFSRQ
jgi:hypothetical protein